MYSIKLGENINSLRLANKLTQEDVANFLGITKASVSKWEKGQSMPDILLLPELATLFHVTIDELIGYEPVLSTEQIRKLYEDFSNDFTHNAPEEVMTTIRSYIHKYYACDAFLIQMALLLLNHYMLFPAPEAQAAVLQEAMQLCRNVKKSSNDIVLIDNAISLETMCHLLLGDAQNVIDTLEPLTTVNRLSRQNDLLLMQAYQLQGDYEKANSFTQINMYLHLMNIIEASIQYLEINKKHMDVCEETVNRIENLITLFQVKALNPNTAARFFFQAALINAIEKQQPKTLYFLTCYCDCIVELLKDGVINLTGDSFFDQVSSWNEAYDLGASQPRSTELIIQSALSGLNHPSFAFLQKEVDYQMLQKRIQALFP